MSIPRSSRIACTQFGDRPKPLQEWSGFCGSRYLVGGRLRRAGPEAAAPSSRKISSELVAFGRHTAFEFGPRILPIPLFARRQVGLGLVQQVGELLGVESGEVDGCHGCSPKIVWAADMMERWPAPVCRRVTHHRSRLPKHCGTCPARRERDWSRQAYRPRAAPARRAGSEDGP